MRSKANIKGHPIHPILIPFPIAFLIGTLVFDILRVTTGNSSYWQTGGYLEIAGIITALIAAIPGVIDYFGTVPPDSSGKKRAATHGLVNLTLVVVFAIAYTLRDDSSVGLIIALESVGTIMLFVSGWLGGTLAYRNQIGVDIRYAGAGKWNEAHIANSSGLIEVAAAGELKTDQMKLIHIGTKRIVLGNTGKGYVAFEDRCCHKGGSLAGGAMICGTVQCPWHGSQFDCKTGAVKAGPAKDDIAVYPVQEKDGVVYISV
ncbi:Rieske 2Fe-2S domain-containing protein [Mucilaginibacter sp. 14171R-50]|uniref:DUF2231 domain-containing protein n=1 Tax=Mucilaginibacter sp. 14171R-50 TaxID=2703789 RepID=UPI00138CB52E|nr:DUF2231 domain-containing protein [Mucilaginibacter sp. 14171R-50]QHS57372.1 Rieske 2Fe-2S domain-containing protein [Mucilaginibacter sp. 14171R-50]